jgi:3-isopropylmalate/(R)-2-methylmalate dehydratase small subunit
MMESFTTHTGSFVLLDRANVDTDQIIPARYLKRIERTGYGEFVFEDISRKDGRPDPDFPLNQPEARDATVLVARQNFGCGSSREHAVWAIAQHGFRAVVAPRVGATPGFADIFRQNAYKNGLLPVEVSEEFAGRLFAAGAGTLTIDLQKQEITAQLAGGSHSERFDVPDGARAMLLEGLDEIGLTLQYDEAIRAFEERHPRVAPSLTSV